MLLIVVFNLFYLGAKTVTKLAGTTGPFCWQKISWFTDRRVLEEAVRFFLSVEFWEVHYFEEY